MKNREDEVEPASGGPNTAPKLGHVVRCAYLAGRSERACGSLGPCGRCELRRAVAACLAGGQVSSERISFARSTIGGPVSASLVVSGASVDIDGQSSLVVCVEDLTEKEQIERRAREVQKLESLGLLASEIAHDFNNMLLAMSLQIGLIAEHPELEGEVSEGLAVLRMAVSRASGLTRQLLAFSRRSGAQMETLELGHVVRTFAKMLRRVLPASIDLAIDVGEVLPPISGDLGMLDQLLMNLAINARDAMPNGGRLTIGTELVSFDAEQVRLGPDRRLGSFVRVVVRDTGCGMDAATKARIFEPFFTTKGEYEGTGLGLASVDSIVREHGGWIEVESEVGVGTAFFLYLPIPAPSNGAESPSCST